ncbi:glycine zipper domain-containing protein [Aneurinibacillus thermoaerophilus]|uniref:glycine zipper domain-containing protein n=1 Tax=Aneurinibacillus thermoaerophilus TaxID=143495 RepID=UPI002E1FC14B|nr:hypothetical protein [Aneurinibacillus thermoaerophilus]
MANEISMDINKGRTMADDFVREISVLENLTNELNEQMQQLLSDISYGDPRYINCITGVVANDFTKGSGERLINQLSENEIYIRSTVDRLEEEDNVIGNLFELHGYWNGVLQAAGHSLFGVAFALTGLTRFEFANGAWRVRYLSRYAHLTRAIDNSKLRTVARYLLGPKYLVRYMDKPLRQVMYRAGVGFFPGHVASFDSGLARLREAARNADTFKGAFGAVKSHAGDLLKASKGFLKTNFVTAFIASGVEESIGLGMNILNNYKEYGNNEAVLKRENAKAVGRAVYNTGVKTATAGVGGVIGGAIGSMLLPGVGTVVGAAAGGFIGSIVGDKIAKHTPAWVDEAALHFKDEIHAGIEKVGDGLRAVGKGMKKAEEGIKAGFKEVKDTADQLLKNAGEFFSKKFSFT